MSDKYLPHTVTFGNESFKYKSTLGNGSEGAVGMYQAFSGRKLSVKASQCGITGGRNIGKKELETALQIARQGLKCKQDLCTSCAYTSSTLLRAPLSYYYKAPCMFSLYEYAPQNLQQWLDTNTNRTPSQVCAFFSQVLTIMLCLGSQGYFYNDLKPDNLLVTSSPEGPKLTIGDLGGIDRKNSPKITITPSRLPKSLTKPLQWSKIDLIGGFLLGEIGFSLLLRPPQGHDSLHPLDNLLNCIQAHGDNASPVDFCMNQFLPLFRNALASGLSLNDNDVRDVAALSLNLMGYKNVGLVVSQLGSLATHVWRSPPSP